MAERTVCLDMHCKDLRARRRTEYRRYSLAAWRECPYYTDRERAALAWTEALTRITHGHASDAVYEEVRPQCTEKELSDLSIAIGLIHALEPPLDCSPNAAAFSGGRGYF